MKDFNEVQIGNLTTDYNDEQGIVVAKGIGYEQFLDYASTYDTGAMAEGFKEEYLDWDNEEWIAVKGDDDQYAVYTYGEDGAFVEEVEIPDVNPAGERF